MTHCLTTLFLVGATVQVIGAFLNKTSSWFTYHPYTGYSERNTRWHRMWQWIAHQYWIDFALDIITLAAFGTAVVILTWIFG